MKLSLSGPVQAAAASLTRGTAYGAPILEQMFLIEQAQHLHQQPVSPAPAPLRLVVARVTDRALLAAPAKTARFQPVDPAHVVAERPVGSLLVGLCLRPLP